MATSLASYLTADFCLPTDAAQATLIGRVWLPGTGPVVALVREGDVFDASSIALTVSWLLEDSDAVEKLSSAKNLPRIASVAELLAASNAEGATENSLRLLAPIDLQAIKASGVTFVASLLERVIEEQARGDASKALTIRKQITDLIGDNLADIQPGSAKADEVKKILIAQNAWSQYLEVGIGPDAEIFTKSQVMSAVGTGAEVGLNRISNWNNPEPEVVLAINSRAEVMGAMLGNDVNLRDVEGRSALLLGKAKDNNASCGLGSFIRLFDAHFGIDDVRIAELSLRIEGNDGYVLDGASSMKKISRDPLDLVSQAIGKSHAYPDGLVLFMGTMFAPTQDRDHPGEGFTHKIGDVVAIRAERIGGLVNRVNYCDAIAPWTFGIGALMKSLEGRVAKY